MTDGGGVVTSELTAERGWRRRDATEFARRTPRRASSLNESNHREGIPAQLLHVVMYSFTERTTGWLASRGSLID